MSLWCQPFSRKSLAGLYVGERSLIVLEGVHVRQEKYNEIRALVQACLNCCSVLCGSHAWGLAGLQSLSYSVLNGIPVLDTGVSWSVAVCTSLD